MKTLLVQSRRVGKWQLLFCLLSTRYLRVYSGRDMAVAKATLVAPLFCMCFLSEM